MPNATLRWIDLCGHAPHIERADETGAGIAWFLDRLDAMEQAEAGQGVA
jgi:pimeloyl-ACP methyl ester carboxylesterase